MEEEGCECERGSSVDTFAHADGRQTVGVVAHQRKAMHNEGDNMKTDFLQHLAINDDATAELHFWKDQLLLAVCSAAGFVLAALAAIAFWPPDSGNPELRAFVRQFWSLFIECALWLGFLLGLLWGAARRLGCALAGSLPWQPPPGRRAAIVRGSGQAGACFALAALLLSIFRQLPGLAEAGTAPLLAALAMLTPACLGLAALCALAAVAGRPAPGKTRSVS
jgi:hypothetical protein